jgi:hypothetical protein
LTDGIEPLSDDGSWSVITDSGVWVRIDRGFLVSYSMELLECEDSPQVGFAGDWFGRIGIQEAHAGHDTSVPNLVAVSDPYVESLTNLRTTVFGTTAAEGAVYCDAFYLIAKALRETRQLPAEPQMVGRSLFLEGVFRAPETTMEVDFALDFSGADGLLGVLVPSAADVDSFPAFQYESAREAAVVHVKRRLSTLFNGLNWNGVGEPEFAQGVVRNLIDHAELSIATRDVAGSGEI